MARRYGIGLMLSLGMATVSLSAMAETPFEQGVVAYGKGDYVEAKKDWEQALAAGDWDAARNLGLLYRKGLGVEPDAARAADYYRQAADHGILNAQLNLAELYIVGQGVPKDLTKAKELLKAASDQGSLPARFRLDEVQEAEQRGENGLALTAPSAGGKKPVVGPSAPPAARPSVAAVAPPPAAAIVAPQVMTPPPIKPKDPLPLAPLPPKKPADAQTQAVAIAPPPAVIPAPVPVVAPPVPVAPEPAAVSVAPPPAPEPVAPAAPAPQAVTPIAPPVEVKVTAPPPPVEPPPAVAESKVEEALPQAEIARAPHAKGQELAALEPGQIRVQVAAYRSESDAARGWLNYNLPGLSPELEGVDLPGKGHFVRLYAVGPTELVHQLCDDAATRVDWCKGK